MSGKQGKKAKQRQQRGVTAGPVTPPAGAPVDLQALQRRVESALLHGEVDLACQLLSQARPSLGGAFDARLAARCYALQAYQRWEKPARAVGSLERAIDLAPESAELRRFQGALLRRTGSAKRSAVAMAEALRLAPEDRRIAFETVLTRLAAGDRGGDLPDLVRKLEGPEAKRAAALLAALDGDLASAERAVAGSQDAVSRLIRAVLLLSQDRAREALPYLEGVVAGEQLPRTAQAYASFYLGIARVGLRRLAEAAEALERAGELGVPESQTQAWLAWVYQQMAIEAVLEGDLSVAARWFDRLAGLSGPQAAEAQANGAHALGLLGQELARKGDYESAAGVWSRALSITPGDIPLRQNLAVALERAGRAAEAIPLWHELVRQVPRQLESRRPGERPLSSDEELRRQLRAVAHRHLADLYLEEDDLEHAIDQMEKAVRSLPEDVENRRSLASLLMDEGQARKAAAQYQQVVAAAPNSAEDRLELALALQASGEWQRAIDEMEKALELQPDNPAARVSLGTTLAERVSLSPAAAHSLEEAQRAVELLPPKYVGLGLVALGAAQLAKGQRKDAQKSFKQAIKGAPIKAIAATRIGEAYWRAGDREAATAAWLDAMKRAKRTPSAFGPLAEMWAMAGDAERCRECLEKLMERTDRWLFALDAVQCISRSRQMQPLIRSALRGLVGGARSTSELVVLARLLLYAGDVPTAGSLLNRAAVDAVEEGDEFVLNMILDLDMGYRLIDRKTARIVADYLERRGYGEEMVM